MNQWKSILLIGLCCLSLFVGCGKKRPEGVPDLYPAKVTVTNAGTPIADANVFLVSQSGASGSWSANGATDAQGVAVINTSQGDWQAKGAPEGEYKIYITKLPDVKEDPVPEEIKNDSDALQKFEQEQMKKLQAAPKIIPEVLTQPAKSPLTLKVAAGSTAELKVDVSEHK
jgi:hypothetical protein